MKLTIEDIKIQKDIEKDVRRAINRMDEEKQKQWRNFPAQSVTRPKPPRIICPSIPQLCNSSDFTRTVNTHLETVEFYRELYENRQTLQMTPLTDNDLVEQIRSNKSNGGPAKLVTRKETHEDTPVYRDLLNVFREIGRTDN
jgi:hypothetical protein